MHKIISNIYLFIIILSLIGLSTGYLYYETQSPSIKEELTTKINIKEDLSHGVNNIPKRLKIILKTLIYSITIIPVIINIFNIFYYPFQIGFILSLLETFSIKLSLIFITIYHLIPLIFTLILIRISFKITKNIIELIIFKDKLSIKHIKSNLKQYLLVSLILLFYEFIILIFSTNINSYLVTFIT
ncbi:MAG: hypothetical protein E7171_04880 [Firmicutes bacterium]|nr:hypothetical protein [Bacillota bacterium]